MQLTKTTDTAAQREQEKGMMTKSVLQTTTLLTVIGFQVWAKVPRSTARKVVLIPYVIIYGLWCAYALSKAS